MNGRLSNHAAGLRRWRFALAGIAVVLLLPALLGGCAHPCGYVEVRARQVILEGEQTVEIQPDDAPFRILEDLSETNPLLVVRVVQREVRSGDIRMDIYGRAVSVPWRWHAPIVKIVVSATGILPIHFAWKDPHRHGADTWSLWDFGRDVISWYNWGSAVSIGRRVIASEEELIRERFMRAPLSEREVGITGQAVDFYVGFEKFASRETDADGKVVFDVGALLTPELVKEDRHITLLTPRLDGEHYETDWNVSAYILRALLKAREAATESPEAAP